jgi:hypothetical protein
MAVISALGRLRQENQEFKANLGYIGRPCLQKSKRKQIRGERQLKSIVTRSWWHKRPLVERERDFTPTCHKRKTSLLSSGFHPKLELFYCPSPWLSTQTLCLPA